MLVALDEEPEERGLAARRPKAVAAEEGRIRHEAAPPTANGGAAEERHHVRQTREDLGNDFLWEGRDA